MILRRRELNRALLERQSLLHRTGVPVTDLIEQLLGLQAQLPNPPYIGLWTRLTRFEPDELSTLLVERAVVRIVLMRGTIHLVTARDCLALRAFVQPMLERDLHTNSTYGRHLLDADLDAIGRAARQLVEATPMTAAQLRAALAPRFPGRDPGALGYAARCLLPMVQIPPRGLWGRSGQPVCTTAQAWLGREPATPDPAAVVRRYLAAFGPASVADMQAWSGLTRLREVTETLALQRFRSESGAELLDLPDAPRPDPETTAPIRFLPPWDNALLSHADRSRIISDEHRRTRINSANGVVPGTVLVDGMVAATWKIEQQKAVATLAIHPFARLSTRCMGTVETEGARLLRFAAPDASPRIRWATAG